MKFRHEVSDQKLRGGYYTPPAMVSFCLSRVDALALPRLSDDHDFLGSRSTSWATGIFWAKPPQG